MSEELTFHQKIIAIQNELKAPKGQKNSFGNYKYRSQEDILEALKPLLEKYNVHQFISDTIELIGNRYYIKSTVTIVGSERGEMLSVSAYAREPQNKKGMDESQITGASSSYARKYALNGLWLIDDTKDADTDEHQQEADNRPKQKPKVNPDNKRWVKAVHAVASGKSDIDFIKKNYDITDEDAERLVAESLEVRESQ